MDEDVQPPYPHWAMPSGSRFSRSLLTIGLPVAALFLIGGLFLLPTADAVRNGKHHPKQVFRSISPDGRHELITSSQVALPANEVTDPAIIATLALRETTTGKELEAQKIELAQESDLDEPLVLWSAGEIRVSTFDRQDAGKVLKFRFNVDQTK